MGLDWEMIGDNEWRAIVPGGWVVKVWVGQAGGVVFVPDPKHEWKSPISKDLKTVELKDLDAREKSKLMTLDVHEGYLKKYKEMMESSIRRGQDTTNYMQHIKEEQDEIRNLKKELEEIKKQKAVYK
jgi:hypothetical protein